MRRDFLVLILAKKNSTRLKNKNYLPIQKKPLIIRTIDFALKISSKKNIFVSTDNEKIINICKKKGVICPWKRPFKLSQKNSTTYATAKHSINWYEKNFNKVNNILLLQPTTPFRSVKDFRKIKKLFFKKNKTVISYTKIKFRNMIQKKYFSYKINRLKKKSLYKNFLADGSYFLIKKKTLIKSKSFFTKDKIPYLNDKFKFGIDIDTYFDYKIASKHQ